MIFRWRCKKQVSSSFRYKTTKIERDNPFLLWKSMLPSRIHPNKAGIKVRTQDDCTSMSLSIKHKHKQKCKHLPKIWEGSLINAQTVQDKGLMSLTNKHRHKKNIVTQPHQETYSTYLSCRWCRWETNACIKNQCSFSETRNTTTPPHFRRVKCQLTKHGKHLEK